MKVLAALVYVLMIPAFAHAAIINVNFEKISAGLDGTTNASGEIDTIANIFSVTSFTTTGTLYSTPLSFPLVMAAFDAGTTPWDVGDTDDLATIMGQMDSGNFHFRLTSANNNHFPAPSGTTFRAGWAGGGIGPTGYQDATSSRFEFWDTQAQTSVNNIAWDTVAPAVVPEPSMALPLLLGFAGVIMRRRRRDIVR